MKVDPQELERVRRRRWKKLMTALAGLALILFVIAAGRLFLIRGELQNFRAFCRMLEKGWPISEVRREAEARGFLFAPDPDPVGFQDDPTFVIRPTPEWPTRFGCRFQARGGSIIKLER